MARLFYVHWNASEAEDHAAVLRKAGHRVRVEARDGAVAIRAVKEAPLDVVVVDLRRLPSQGEGVGVALRSQKATRSVPLVFVAGDAAKTARVKKLLPDAEFASWRGIRGAVRRAMERPPAAPVVPSSRMASYAKAPLAKKLGIRAGTRVALVGAPEGFEATLGALPEGVLVRRGARGRADLTLWFVTRRRDLEARLDKMKARAAKGGLWIVWPKRASGRGSDLSQPVVRRIGLESGLVDFKICAVDETWSGLRFTLRATMAP